jgi:hypothetical protein
MLTGKWYAQQDTMYTYINGKNTGYTHAVGAGPVNTGLYIEFNKNGSGAVSYGDVRTFTYALSGNLLTLNYPEFKFTLNSATITAPAVTYKPVIKILTANKLELYYDYSEASSPIHYIEVAYYIKN